MLLVLAGLISFTQPASAAKLNLVFKSGGLFVTSAGRCSGDTLAVSINGKVAAVSGISAGCSGRTLRVFVSSNGSTLTETVVITGRTATLTLTSAIAAAQGVTATIDTWPVPVTWSVEPPSSPATSVIFPDTPTTTMTRIDWDMPAQTGNLNFCVSVTITGATAGPQPWELRARLDKAPFNGMDASSVYYQGTTQVRLRTAGNDPSILVITGTGDPANAWNPDWNNVLLDSSKTLVVKLCVGNAPVPSLGDPGWYTASVSRGEWTSGRACKVLTVKGNVTDLAANPFYFTWKARLDVADARQHILDAGRTINWVEFSPPPSDGYQFSLVPDSNATVPDGYMVQGGRMLALRGTQQVTVTACVIAN